MANVGQKESGERATNPPKGMTLDQKFDMAVGTGIFTSRWLDLFIGYHAGTHYHGTMTACSIFLGFLWIACTEPYLAPLFFYACFGALALQKFANLWADPSRHSMHRGQRIIGDGVACILTVIVGSIAWGARLPSLGSWLVVSGIGLGLTEAYRNTRDKAAARHRKDALALMGATQARWQAAPVRRGGIRTGVIIALAAACGVGWLLYTGRIALPPTLVSMIPKVAPLTEEQKAEIEEKEAARQAEQEWREMEARDRAIRRAWRRRNEEAGFYY